MRCRLRHRGAAATLCGVRGILWTSIGCLVGLCLLLIWGRSDSESARLPVLTQSIAPDAWEATPSVAMSTDRTASLVEASGPAASTIEPGRAVVQAPEHLVVRGRATRRGQPVADVSVELVGFTRAGVRVFEMGSTDADGWFELRVLPGEYQVWADDYGVGFGEGSNVGAAGFMPSGTFEVADEDVRVDFTCNPGRIEVTVVDHQGTAVPNTEVTCSTVWAADSGNGQSTFAYGANSSSILSALTDAAGRCTFDGLGLREFSIQVRSSLHVATAPTRHSLTEAGRFADVRVVLQSAGCVQLELIDEDGFGADLGGEPFRRVGLQKVGGPLVRPTRLLSSRFGATPLEFAGIAPGRYLSKLESETVDAEGRVRFEPIAAVGSEEIEVREGQATKVELSVVARPYLRLRGVRDEGAVTVGIRVTVIEVATGRVVLPVSPWADRSDGGWNFFGYVPPGSYLVRFQSDRGDQVEKLVRVKTDDIARGIRLPW